MTQTVRKAGSGLTRAQLQVTEADVLAAYGRLSPDRYEHDRFVWKLLDDWQLLRVRDQYHTASEAHDAGGNDG